MAEPLASDFKLAPYWWEAAEPGFRDSVLPPSSEVVVVGGGYAGLSAALTFRRLGHEVTVLDAERIGWGASSRNGGMVSGGLKVPLDKLAGHVGKEKAEDMAAAASAAFPFIEELIEREKIACDYVRCGAFLCAWTPAHYRALAKKAETLAALTGASVRLVPRERQHEEFVTDHYHGGLVKEATGSLHPGKYARGLAAAAERAGALLVDRVRVQAIDQEGSGFKVRTDKGQIRASGVIVTVNGYAKPATGSGALPWLTRRLVPVTSYIIATEPLGRERVRSIFPKLRTVSDTKRVLNYFRPSPDGQRILWGGRASFRLGTTPREAAPVLHRTMTEALPVLKNVRLTHAWSGNVTFTLDGLPHVGVHDGIHYAAGCQGSGVAMMSWLGHQAALLASKAGNAPFALNRERFPTLPFYAGRPWFLPVVGEWFRLRDRLDRLLA
ncbi:Glycine/D-amino acid oxidase [Arboricoccus pini]|uniref:Glycine/D-amino acid oxidase n=1 Tax=Arboricoccus pini TaxID=1963835 RepID=A0A212RPD0_9PROT|nr:FAD-binding oxidoreductase [Arboricoccus pini]SNB74292.1 Glycine/D-amino acid oxidase [Arboricoccus pini]